MKAELIAFAAQLGGKPWEKEGRFRVYFNGKANSAYVEFALNSDGEVDLLEGSHTEASIKARSIPSAAWLRSQKEIVLEYYRPQLAAVQAFSQIHGDADGRAVDLEAHTEEVIDLRDFGLPLAVAMTDVATIAGVSTGADGAFLVRLDDPAPGGVLKGHIWCPCK